MSPESFGGGGREKGRSFHVDWGAGDGKGVGTNTGKSGWRNLEAASIRGIRNRAESTARKMCEAEDRHGDKKEQCV